MCLFVAHSLSLASCMGMRRCAQLEAVAIKALLLSDLHKLFCLPQAGQGRGSVKPGNLAMLQQTFIGKEKREVPCCNVPKSCTKSWKEHIIPKINFNIYGIPYQQWGALQHTRQIPQT